MVRRALALLAIAASAPACKPDLNQRLDVVTTPRVLAVRAEPAEVQPGKPVTMTALYVDASGAIASGPFDWAFCEDRKPLAELGPVSPRCAQASGGWFLELGASSGVTASVPADACRQFGPEVPEPLPNQPPGRPVDPDPTGGFYQPARLVAGADVAVLRVRVTCSVAGVSPEQLGELQQRYHPNVNPQVDAVADAMLGPLADEGQGTTSVARGQRLALRASWAACDPTAPSCTGSEGYATYDVTTHTVVDRREEMRVSWFATGGSFDDDTTGRDATDPTPYVDDGWTAPSDAGTYHLWVVVRDDRGGASWRSFVIVVT